MTFVDDHPIEKRIKISNKILQAGLGYPVILYPYQKKTLFQWIYSLFSYVNPSQGGREYKWLINGNIRFRQFLPSQLGKMDASFYLPDDSKLNLNLPVSKVYEEHKSQDKILYIGYY